MQNWPVQKIKRCQPEATNMNINIHSLLCSSFYSGREAPSLKMGSRKSDFFLSSLILSSVFCHHYLLSMASEMVQNSRTINWSHPTNTITFNEHDHIQQTRSHSTFNKRNHIQHFTISSHIQQARSHPTSTITFNKHDHIQPTQSHSTSAITFKPANHVQDNFFVVNKSHKPLHSRRNGRHVPAG